MKPRASEITLIYQFQIRRSNPTSIIMNQMQENSRHHVGVIEWTRRQPTEPSPAVSFARQYAAMKGLEKMDLRRVLAHRALQRRGFENLLDLLIHQLHHQQLLVGGSAYTHIEASTTNIPIANDFCAPDRKGDEPTLFSDTWLESDERSDPLYHGKHGNATDPIFMTSPSMDSYAESNQRGFQRSA
jgi:hypothetical protein